MLIDSIIPLDGKIIKSDRTYLLCPDSSCDLFLKPDVLCPCEYDCPKQDDLVKIIKCNGCGEAIELSGDHDPLRRVGHSCSDGRHAENFQRNNGKYELIRNG